MTCPVSRPTPPDRGLRTLTAVLWAALALSLGACRSTAVKTCDWQHWSQFKQHYLSEDGRVIDTRSARQHTVSEGQAYALFFALVGNDRETFDRLLRWTEDNLAQGDFGQHLPAWIWGRRDDGSWGVIDPNPASDADLWIAYALSEAARLWQAPQYAALSDVIGRRVLADEVADLPKLGPVLLPAPFGFVEGEGRWRLNPSYTPLQVLRGLHHARTEPAWAALLPGSLQLLIESAPQGYSPDWVLYDADAGFLPDEKTQGLGSYDAIRTYLWAGMLHPADPLRAALLDHLRPMERATTTRGAPPERIDTRTGTLENDGNVGFSASLLPFLQALGANEALERERRRVEATAVEQDPKAYYENVLALFGRGWDQGYFRFTAEGTLQTRWETPHCLPLR